MGISLAYFDRKDDYSYIRWAQNVKRRDHYTCSICGRKGVQLNSHHLNAWAEYPNERYDVDNGTTLCTFHHEDFHAKFGKGKNTKEQFKQYKDIAEQFIKIANQESIMNLTVRKMIQQAEQERIVTDIVDHLNKERSLEDGYIK